MKVLDMILVNILEEHWEELDIHFACREQLFRSKDYTFNDLLEMEERIEAHLNGLLIDEASISSHLENGLSRDEKSSVFISAFALLRMQKESTAQLVMSSFKDATGDRFQGIRDALCFGPINHLEQQLREMFTLEPSFFASAAGEILAFHKQLNPNSSRFHEFFSDKDSEVRRTGWRILALLA
jgi:hypothetical protein